MGNIVIPQKSIIARALREPNLITPRKKGQRVVIADKYNDAAVFILPSGGTGKANDLKGNWDGSNSLLTDGVDEVGHHFGPTDDFQSGNTLNVPLPAATDRTLVAVFKLDSFNALSNVHPIDGDRDNSNRHFQLRVSASGVATYIVWNGVNVVSSSNTMSLNELVTLIAYTDHTRNIIGVSLKGVDNEASYTNTLVECDEFFTCGQIRGETVNNFDGHLYLAGAWNRCFTAEERQEIYRNPFGALTKPANDSPFIIGAAAAVGGVSITVPQADLVLSTTAPTIVATANISIDVPSANLVLSTTAPTVATGASVDINVPQANLLLSTTAPIVAATANIGITVPNADLTLTTNPPTVDVTEAGEIVVPTADLLLSTTAPTVSATANISIEIPQANLALTSEAPTVGISWNIVVPQGDLSLSTTAPTVLQGFNIFVPSADLALSTIAPTVSATTAAAITVPTANLALSTTAPTVEQTGIDIWTVIPPVTTIWTEI